MKVVIEDLEPDYKCLEREVSRVEQDRAVFSKYEVLIDIFGYWDRQIKVGVRV